MDKRLATATKLGEAKTLTIGIEGFSFRYSLYGTVFEQVELTRDPGVIIQSNLNFTLQYNNATKKLHYRIKYMFITLLKIIYGSKNCSVTAVLESATQGLSATQKKILTGLSLYRGTLQGLLLVQRICDIRIRQAKLRITRMTENKVPNATL